MRRPFRKRIGTIEKEAAHGGSGARQLLLSKSDPVSSQLEAMIKGFLAAGGVFDWHSHEDLDEFFLVMQGTGTVTFSDGRNMLTKAMIYFTFLPGNPIESRTPVALTVFFTSFG